jgi:uncharacterized protein (TIGR03435 family)
VNLRLAGIAAMTVIAMGHAQSLPSVRPAFDVASIKPAPPDERTWGYRFEPGGRMVVSHFRLADLMLIGWHILPFQVVGGPAWAYSETYDIEAKAAGNPDSDQSRVMLQSLLADRFHLVLRCEVRELPMYALVTAKKGARPAAGLVRAQEGDCTPSQDVPPPPLEAGKPPYCRVTEQLRRQGNGAPSMQLRGYGVTLSMLARHLASIVNQQVENDTGIANNYDISMDYAPYNENDNELLTPKPDTGIPSLFTALQEQLGLKLEARKGPVEVFVIDHSEKPSAN